MRLQKEFGEQINRLIPKLQMGLHPFPSTRVPFE